MYENFYKFQQAIRQLGDQENTVNHVINPAWPHNAAISSSTYRRSENQTNIIAADNSTAITHVIEINVHVNIYCIGLEINSIIAPQKELICL